LRFTGAVMLRIARSIVVALLTVCFGSSLALADITTYMEVWDYIPQVQISQGTNQDCGQNNLVYNSSMTRGFQQNWPGSGDQGDDVCWRRTRDPLDASSGLDDVWTRCASSSSLMCEIN
jgi:hypothetical protein